MWPWLVRDVMTRDVVTVGEWTRYKEIVDTLAKHAIGAAPVVDTEGRVIGIVSEADLLHKLELCGTDAHVRLLEPGRYRTAWTRRPPTRFRTS